MFSTLSDKNHQLGSMWFDIFECIQLDWVQILLFGKAKGMEHFSSIVDQDQMVRNA